jgi:Organic solute transporter Ostalpha
MWTPPEGESAAHGQPTPAAQDEGTNIIPGNHSLPNQRRFSRHSTGRRESDNQDESHGVFNQLVNMVAGVIAQHRRARRSRATGSQQLQREFSGEADLSASLLSSTEDRDDGLQFPPPPPPGLGLRQHSSSTVFAARQLIRQMGDYLAYVTLLAMLVLIPTVTYHALSSVRKPSQRPAFELAAFDSAGVMVIGTLVLSLRLVYLHLTHWYMPSVQKYVVRILWMVPLYAIQSWFSLRFHSHRIYIDSVRDLYEAYVIASFVYYLTELLGGPESLVRILEQKRHTDPNLGTHAWPLNLLLDNWELGTDFMLQCKHGVLQYVVFKILATFFTLVCESLGIYHEGTFHWDAAYPYLCFLQNMSVMYALYCLVMLYTAINNELRSPINWNPLGKFLCVKGVVFFTWWQGVIIFYLRAHGFIENTGTWSSEDVANGLINYCIIIEMIFFAIAHSYTFSYKEYLPSAIQHAVTAANDGAYRPNHGFASQMRNAHAPQHTRTGSNSLGPPSSAFAGYDPIAALEEQHESDLFDQAPRQEAAGLDRGDRTNLARFQEADPMKANGDFNGGGVRFSNKELEREDSMRRSTSEGHNITGLVYRPPATLPTPMNFREALWSSTVPHETIQDLQSLQLLPGSLTGGSSSNRARCNSGQGSTDELNSPAISLRSIVRFGNRIRTFSGGSIPSQPSSHQEIHSAQSTDNEERDNHDEESGPSSK